MKMELNTPITQTTGAKLLAIDSSESFGGYIPLQNIVTDIKDYVDTADNSIAVNGTYDEDTYTFKYEAATELGTAYATSTFTGWGGHMGTPQNFDTVIFKIINRDTTTITSCRVVIRVFNKSGTVLVDKVFTGLSVAAGASYYFKAYLGTVIANSSANKLWFAFQCPNLVTLAFTSAPSAGDDTTYGYTAYSTSTSLIQATTAWNNIATSSAIVPWCQCFLKETKTARILNSDLKVASNLITKDSSSWLSSFTLADNPNSFTSVYEFRSYNSLQHASSTFSGWGGDVGTPQNFNAVKFRVVNRGASAITAIKVYICQNNRLGTILAAGNLSVNLASGSDTTIVWNIGSTIANSSASRLFFAYECNQLITLAAAIMTQNGDDVTYAKTSYTTNGAFVLPSNLQENTPTNLTVWTQFGTVSKYWKPTALFYSTIPGGGGSSTAEGVSYDNSTSELSSTNVQTAIDELKSNIDSGGEIYPAIMLPDEVVAVVGDKLQLFVRGFIEAMNPYNKAYDIQCAVGASYPRYFEYTPVIGDVGTKMLTVNIRDNAATVKNTKTINIIVKNPTAQPASNKNVLCVGDSLTSNGEWVQEFYRRITQSGGSPAGHGFGNTTFIGQTPLPLYPTQKFTGYGGWTYGTYTGASPIVAYWVTATHDKDVSDQKAYYTDANGKLWFIETLESGQLKMVAYSHSNALPSAPNTLTWYYGGTHHTAINYTDVVTGVSTPFWDSANNVFSFSSWATANSISNIDICYVLLGWNGLSATYDPNLFNLTNCMAFLDRLLADFPSCLIRIMGIQMPSNNGGLGTNYGANPSSVYSNYFSLIKTVNALNTAYQNLVNDPMYSTNCKHLGVACQFDSEWNMPYTTNAVNSRNTTTENRGTNGVHPSTAGYMQIADTAYRDYIRTFCSE